jgi:hypothetical protein
MVEMSNNLQDFSSSGILYRYHMVSVLQVEPHFASQLGGDELTVLGTNFMPPHEGDLFCIIGTSTPVMARWESANMLTCETQSTRESGPVPLSLSSNETIFKGTTTLVFLKRPQVEMIAPLRGPVRGGTKVTLGGEFPTGVTDRCFFGSILTVPRCAQLWACDPCGAGAVLSAVASVVCVDVSTHRLRSHSSYECYTPPMPTASTVQVTVNQDTSAPAVHYRFYEEPVVISVKPPKGPVSGGTYVEISGLQFDFASAELDEVTCRFNTTRVPATFVTSTLLQCVAPKSGEGHVDVEVSMNLVEYSSTGVQFQYQAVVRARHSTLFTKDQLSDAGHLALQVIDRAFPVNGPVKGNTTVVLTGMNFAAPCINCHINKDLWCMFGHAPRVPAYYDSSNQISCVSPLYNFPGVVSISIINTDAIYVHKVAFRYELPTQAIQLTPLLGPTAGGTRVTIDGMYLNMQVLRRCRILLPTITHEPSQTPTFTQTLIVVCRLPSACCRLPRSVALVTYLLPSNSS